MAFLYAVVFLFTFVDIDISYADFPGIIPHDGGFIGPRPTTEMHPHMMLDKTMTSVPKVFPGDTVFWHCDVVHSVEREHTGNEDSSGTLLHSGSFLSLFLNLCF